jgi:hypothetical protein
VGRADLGVGHVPHHAIPAEPVCRIEALIERPTYPDALGVFVRQLPECVHVFAGWRETAEVHVDLPERVCCVIGAHIPGRAGGPHRVISSAGKRSRNAIGVGRLGSCHDLHDIGEAVGIGIQIFNRLERIGQETEELFIAQRPRLAGRHVLGQLHSKRIPRRGRSMTGGALSKAGIAGLGLGIGMAEGHGSRRLGRCYGCERRARRDRGDAEHNKCHRGRDQCSESRLIALHRGCPPHGSQHFQCAGC